MDGLLALLKIVGYYAGLLYATWVLFGFVMAVKAAKDAGRLPTITYWLAFPIYIIALLADFALNVASTFVFWEFNGELLLTHRCNRHLLESTGYRWWVAHLLCKYILDPFQIGGHCSKIDTF